MYVFNLQLDKTVFHLLTVLLAVKYSGVGGTTAILGTGDSHFAADPKLSGRLLKLIPEVVRLNGSTRIKWAVGFIADKPA